jgi:hypothetical protein
MTPWRETRGEYKYIRWTKPNCKPWEEYRTERQEAERKRFTQITAADIDWRKDIDPLHETKRYDSNIADAWSVVEAMQNHERRYAFWTCLAGKQIHRLSSKDAAETICQAALWSVDVPEAEIQEAIP